MRERDRRELDRFLAGEQAEEQRRREESLKPVREAEAKLTETIRQLHSNAREAVLSGQPDPDFVLPASVAGRRMPLPDAQKFNKDEAAKFVAANPDYYPSEKNFETVTNYLVAQKVAIVDAATWKAAVGRLRALGLLEVRPEPEPQPEAQLQETVPPDPDELPFGAERAPDGTVYTREQIDAMSSEQYARVFRVPRYTGYLTPVRSV